MELRMKSRRVKSLKDALKIQPAEMKKIRDSVDAEFRQNMQAQFKSEGATGGETWAPLSESYRKWKKKRFPGRKILTQKGKLRNSLTRKGGDHIARHNLKRRTVEVGTKNPIGAYHAPGRMHGDNLPVRDPLQHSRPYLDEYRRVILENFREMLKRRNRAVSRLAGAR